MVDTWIELGGGARQTESLDSAVRLVHTLGSAGWYLSPGKLVRDAGALASKMLREGLETRYKTSISDVVSAADQAAEDRISRRLAESRPDDGLVGEGHTQGRRRTDVVHRSRRWHVQLSVRYPVLVLGGGLMDSDGPLLGAVYYPAVDQLWTGGREFPTTQW